MSDPSLEKETTKAVNNKEIAILAESINICLAAVELSEMGAVFAKKDEANLSNDMTNLIINQAAMAVFQMILKEKLAGMYLKQQAKGA